MNSHIIFQIIDLIVNILLYNKNKSLIIIKGC